MWLAADLTDLDLVAAGEPEPFDAAVRCGNVMPYLAPGTEQAVLTNLAAHPREDAFLVVGLASIAATP